MKKVIIINCRSCGGTGIYQTAGMNGHCSLCFICMGSGGEKFSYTVFKGKISTAGVFTVKSTTGNVITYEEFAKGIMP